MARSATLFRRGSEFDDFLFASIGVERNGNPVSVLSALARQNLDPWQEAADLARLPIDVAVHRLAVWIGALPSGLLESRNSQAVAARLIECLPRKLRSDIAVGAIAPGAIARPWIFAVYVVFMILALGMQWSSQNRKPPMRVDNVHAAGAITAKMPASRP
jgi:hypothetical protein